MNTILYDTNRENMVRIMDEVCVDHAPVIINRGQAKSVVLLSLDDYQFSVETAFLMRSPKNTLRLLNAINTI
jgi:antitoxin YefM